MSDERFEQGEGEFPQELLRGAGARPSIPSDDFEVIRNEARTVWRARFVKEPATRNRWPWALPLAAALCMTVVLAWWFAGRKNETSPPPVAAQVVSIHGTSGFVAGQTLPAGTEVRTATGSWLELVLAGGQSLRLDDDTAVVLVSSDSVSLERGRLYFDSLSRSPVTFSTVAGDFIPHGTQFELSLVDAAVHLRVREGQVELRPVGKSTPAVTRAGEQLIVREDGTLYRSEIARSHPDWDWILAAARVPDIEGRTLQSFIDWTARERGWNVEFGSSESALLAREVILHGSVSDMAPEDALNTVMLSSGFSYRVSNGTLVVSRP